MPSFHSILPFISPYLHFLPGPKKHAENHQVLTIVFFLCFFDFLVDPMHYPVDFTEFIERRLPLVSDSGSGSTYGSSALPAHLPRHDPVTRPNVIAVGHSIGGSAV